MLIVRPHVGPSATAFARSPLPPAVALERIAAYPIPAMFVGWGVFPAVAAVDDETWDHVGASRVHRLADGGTVTETMIEYTAGVGFAYELIGFTDVFGKLVRGVRGEWSVSHDGTGLAAALDVGVRAAAVPPDADGARRRPALERLHAPDDHRRDRGGVRGARPRLSAAGAGVRLTDRP
ncbi:hypothetical protein [Amnibacterium kyonggiense]